MKSLIDTTQVASDLSKKADALLEGVDHSPFSVPAFDVLRGRVGQYIGDLVRESATIAKHESADVISAKHVEAAYDRLTISPQRRFYRHLGPIAGLFFGGFISTVASMVVAGQYPLLGIALAAASGIVGAFLYGVHVTRD
jgi:hypothetical protein